jgi:hypothetical protein
MAPSTTPSAGRRSRFGARRPVAGSSSTPTWAAGIADHLTLWDACYRSIQLLGRMSRFVLSTSAPTSPRCSTRRGNRRPPSGSTRGTQPTRRSGSLRPRRGGPVGGDRSIPNPAATPAARRRTDGRGLKPQLNHFWPSSRTRQARHSRGPLTPSTCPCAHWCGVGPLPRRETTRHDPSRSYPVRRRPDPTGRRRSQPAKPRSSPPAAAIRRLLVCVHTTGRDVAFRRLGS